MRSEALKFVLWTIYENLEIVIMNQNQ